MNEKTNNEAPFNWYRFLTEFLKCFAFFMALTALAVIWIQVYGGKALEKQNKALQGFSSQVDWSAIPKKKAIETVEKIEGKPVSLTPAPAEGLFEVSSGGTLPIISRTGLTPFEAYKRPVSFEEDAVDKPKIALGLMNFCTSRENAELATLILPGSVSFIANPYCPDLNEQISKARENGHEIWLVLPMETTGFPLDDEGPDVLLKTSSPEKNYRRLIRIMETASGYIGLSTSQNAYFTSSKADFHPVLEEIYKRGLGFLDTNPQSPEYLKRLSLRYESPFLANNVWIDQNATNLYITANFQKIETFAQANGYVTALFHPYPNSIQMVAEWIKSLDKKGFVTIPLSAAAGF